MRICCPWGGLRLESQNTHGDCQLVRNTTSRSNTFFCSLRTIHACKTPTHMQMNKCFLKLFYCFKCIVINVSSPLICSRYNKTRFRLRINKSKHSTECKTSLISEGGEHFPNCPKSTSWQRNWALNWGYQHNSSPRGTMGNVVQGREDYGNGGAKHRN